jgi:hypothetical protein
MVNIRASRFPDVRNIKMVENRWFVNPLAVDIWSHFFPKLGKGMNWGSIIAVVMK